jgi:3-oxoacyl-[acyl-carrier-protein] synthase II
MLTAAASGGGRVTPAERIAIEAAGVVTPLGQDVEGLWSGLVTGASGISRIERFPVDDMRVGRGGEIKKLSRPGVWGRVPDCRATRLLVCAADELDAHTGIRSGGVAPGRLAVVVGTALGGVE